MSMAWRSSTASRGWRGNFRLRPRRSATGAAKARTYRNCVRRVDERENNMIQLKDVSYVRLCSPDLESAESFATSCLGLQIAERGKKDLYLRSDGRAHTLCYTEGDPNTQTVGFEVEDEASLQEAASATGSAIFP